MTKEELLFQLRGNLDEVTADFYVDATTLYGALTNAQLEIAKVLADDYSQKKFQSKKPVKIPTALMPLKTTEAGTVNSATRVATITDSPLAVVSVNWQTDGALVEASPWCVELAEGNDGLRIVHNKYLQNGYYFWWNQDNLYLNPLSSDNSAAYSIVFIDTPKDISASIEPELADVAHDAIVERATWVILNDRENDQAQLHLGLYTQLLKNLML